MSAEHDRILPPEQLRDLLLEDDALRMLFAETRDERQRMLRHDRGGVCTLDRTVEGDCGCSAAVMEVVDDVVDYYRRKLGEGRRLTLHNPVGWARTIVRLRATTVIRQFATPDGYQNTARLASATAAPKYLPVEDQVDRLLLRAAVEYVRMGFRSRTWQDVTLGARADLARRGVTVTPDEARRRLDRIVAAAYTAGGKAAAFIHAELLDRLNARSVRLLGDQPPVGTPAGCPDPDEQADMLEEAVQVMSLLDRLDEALPAGHSWPDTDAHTKRDALREVVERPLEDADLQALIELVDLVWDRNRLGKADQ